MEIRHHLAPAGAALSLWQADCRDALRLLPSNSIDSCVTDPPYALVSIVKRFGAPDAAPAQSGKSGVYASASAGFMGQTWDTGEVAFAPEFWADVLRVLKPGAHLLAFGGTRTYHRLACAIEDAGFEIRDQIGWAYGSGFPKSHNLDGVWDGWGTALKPAWEPIILARKPLEGTVAANMARWSVGGLNIGACRVGDEVLPGQLAGQAQMGTFVRHDMYTPERVGRWPANLIHDGSEEVLAAFPGEAGAAAPVRGTELSAPATGEAVYNARKRTAGAFHADKGSAARFFYCAKASKKDREHGCEAFEPDVTTDGRAVSIDNPYLRGETTRKNKHPTVKPTELMRYLCRLVTPPHGVVLDPFMGSGSTGRGAALEGFGFIGIEREAEYWRIANARVGVLLK